MITPEEIRHFALSLPGATEAPHFEKTSFRTGGKIFATMNAEGTQLTVKLDELHQEVFGTFNRKLVHPVPNQWGRQGWTIVHFPELPVDLVQDILRMACQITSVAKKRRTAK